MTPIEKARAALKQERSRKAEFYKGAAYALKLAEAAQVGESERPKTNGDRVRAMSDEELVKFFSRCIVSCGSVCIEKEGCYDGKSCYDIKSCYDGMLAWLKQEAER